jgi:hypothetical protein
MFFGILSNHLLDIVGIFQIITITIKITRGHPVRRWFF